MSPSSPLRRHASDGCIPRHRRRGSPQAVSRPVEPPSSTNPFPSADGRIQAPDCAFDLVDSWYAPPGSAGTVTLCKPRLVVLDRLLDLGCPSPVYGGRERRAIELKVSLATRGCRRTRGDRVLPGCAFQTGQGVDMADTQPGEIRGEDGRAVEAKPLAELQAVSCPRNQHRLELSHPLPSLRSFGSRARSGRSRRCQ
jgi:hypothetical protein